VTFDAAEIDEELWRESSRGCVTWETTFRTPEGDVRTSLHANPGGAARSGAVFEIGAVYRLVGRTERPPLFYRVPGPEARAWIFALGATQLSNGGTASESVVRS
jgi:hypothetical protein